jgi:hypothetical protein
MGSAEVEEEALEEPIVGAGEERCFSISISGWVWGKEDAGVGYSIANCYKNRNRYRNWGWKALDIRCDGGDERVVSEKWRDFRKDYNEENLGLQRYKKPRYAFTG